MTIRRMARRGRDYTRPGRYRDIPATIAAFVATVLFCAVVAFPFIIAAGLILPAL